MTAVRLERLVCIWNTTQVLRGVVYETIHPGEIFIEDDIYGNVDTVHRVRNLTAKQAEELFGYDSLPQHVKDLLKTNPYKEEEWLHCVYPRKNWDKSSLLSVKKNTPAHGLISLLEQL